MAGVRKDEDGMSEDEDLRLKMKGIWDDPTLSEEEKNKRSAALLQERVGTSPEVIRVPHVPVAPEELAQIFAALKKRGVKDICTECRTKRELLPGYIHHPIIHTPTAPEEMVGLTMGVMSNVLLSTVLVICPRCGNLNEFVYNILTMTTPKGAPPKVPEAPPKRHLGLVPMPSGDLVVCDENHGGVCDDKNCYHTSPKR